MEIDLSKLPIRPIPFGDILADPLTDFSLRPDLGALKRSIRELGVTHPVTLLPNDGKYRVVCGHQRIRLAKEIGLKDIPARVLDGQLDSAACLKMNILDNLDHWSSSCVEKGLILNKLSAAGVADDDLINIFLPLLGLEPGKKLIEDYKKTSQFSSSLNLLLHEMKIPIRVFSVFFDWQAADRDAAEKALASLRLGVNKWREFLELVDETARRDGAAPVDILERDEILSIMENNEIPQNKKYDSICQVLRNWRYPALSDLRRRFLLALDKLDLDPRTKIRAAKYFENDEIKIELKFSRQKDLLAQLEKLSTAAGSEAMRELIKVVSDTGQE